jgi:hypothetical protein
VGSSNRGLGKMHKRELHNLYPLQNIITMIKSGAMRLVGQVACMGVKMGAYRALVGKPERKTCM